MTKMLGFRPKNKEHAIHEASFALRFSEPVAGGALDRIAAVAEKIQRDLPDRDTVTSVSMSHVGARYSSSEPAVSGYIFQKRSPNSSELPEWGLRIQEDLISVSCLLYTTYDAVWKRVRDYFLLLAPLVTTGSRVIRQISLQYTDHFIADSALDSPGVESVLNTATTLLPSHVFAKPSPWQVYQGWFEVGTEKSKLLAVLDVTLEHFGEPVRLVINNSLSRDLPPDVSRHLHGEAEIGEAIDKYFSELHQRNKDILMEVLTPEMCQRINLGLWPKGEGDV
jgi:uncharacterized protein (TIGR04255 family)